MNRRHFLHTAAAGVTAAIGVPVAGHSASAGARFGEGRRTAAGFAHPGLLSSADELAGMKRKVHAGEEPWRTAYGKLPSYLDHVPHPRWTPFGLPASGGLQPPCRVKNEPDFAGGAVAPGGLNMTFGGFCMAGVSSLS